LTFLGLLEVTFRQVCHDVFEDDRVNVVAQHINQEPVSYGCLADNCVQMVQLSQSESHAKDVDSNRRTGNDYEMEEDHDGSDPTQEKEPKPDEDVNLLVNDVQGKNTQGIHGLDVG